jgi:hypothetical protein
MESQNSSFWAPVRHEDPRRSHSVDQQDNAYDMYPGPDGWGKPDARDTSEENQHWKREANGGLGHAGYEGMSDVAPSRPLSAAAAAVSSTVRLG